MPELVTDTYLTIADPSAGLFKDRGSKFISFAFPINTEEEVKLHLEKIKKEFFDARHHCYAFRLGTSHYQTRAADDGEPSNSAGKPILGQIVAFNLTQVLVIVVRYFGGTLLGVGGLIQAYKQAASDALQQAKIIEKEILDTLHLSFEYAQQSAVNRILKEFNVKITRSEFDYNCRVEIQCRKSITPGISAKINELQFVTLSKNDLPNQKI